MALIPSKFSLLKYDNPILVSHSNEPCKSATVQSTSTYSETSSTSSKSKSGNAATLTEEWLAKDTQDMLDSILPPKEWLEDGQLWIQHVSSIPATRTDVVALQEQMDAKLLQRQARETGICPVRRELYSQCFDEIIRQVAINCAERGLLLLRVRDEINMTMAAYQTLYESSIAFGIRKALNAEKGRADMEQQIEELLQSKKELENQVSELKCRYEQSEQKALEQQEMMERKHADELQFFRKTNQQLKAQLEGIIASKK
ncbi:Axonemal dynein light intermediate polypeptide 1 [Chamberlinius hualienensis]